MHARHRSAIILGLLALVVFIVRWPMDNTICNPKLWVRPTPTEGTDFFKNVFRGGGGTPAVFAMLGGQRYMVANILWNYADVLFHKGKIYEMVYPYESTVTLNPAFTEAWSTYGWHLAWNLYSDAKDMMDKQKWLRDGENVYIRAITVNKDKPAHRADLARLYMDREGNYRKALNVLEPVLYPNLANGDYKFEPLTADRKNNTTDVAVISQQLWDPQFVGHRLAIIYNHIGIYTGDWRYVKKAIDVYQLCLNADSTNRNTLLALKNLTEVYQKRDMQWMNGMRMTEAKIRKNYMFPELHFGDPIEKLWPDENGKSGGDTGIPGDKLRY